MLRAVRAVVAARGRESVNSIICGPVRKIRDEDVAGAPVVSCCRNIDHIPHRLAIGRIPEREALGERCARQCDGARDDRHAREAYFGTFPICALGSMGSNTRTYNLLLKYQFADEA